LDQYLKEKIKTKYPQGYPKKGDDDDEGVENGLARMTTSRATTTIDKGLQASLDDDGYGNNKAFNTSRSGSHIRMGNS